MLRRVGLTVLCLGLVASPLAAFAQKAKQPAAKESKAKESKSKVPKSEESKAKKSKSDQQDADFAELYTKYKTAVSRMTQLRERYRTDPVADKKALEAEFNAKLEEASDMRPQLAIAAEKAYQAAPNQDSDVNDFLFAYLTGLVGADDFEPAAKLSKLLADNDYQHKFFNVLAGLSFFATSDFEAAGKHLQLAADNKEIDETSQRYLSMVDKYKEQWAKEKKIRAEETKTNDLPKVKLTTSKGDIVVVLFENEAPIATSNFITLVEQKKYDGLPFHRVLTGFMAQGGDPKGDGSGGPGYTIPCECEQEDHRIHFRGSLSMAHAGKDTGGSQFFLTFLPTAHLDGKHTVFGRVIQGMDVLAKLQRCQPGDAGVPDKIVKATVLSKRKHKYDDFIKKPDPRK